MTLLTGPAIDTRIQLAVTIRRLKDSSNRFHFTLVEFLNLRRPPRRQLPLDAREALQLQGFAFPAPTRGAGAVKGAETGIDGAGVGLGAETVGCCGGFGFAVVTMLLACLYCRKERRVRFLPLPSIRPGS